MESIALAALMCALTGDTDAGMIADYVRVHADFFKRCLPEAATDGISHNTVRINLMLVELQKFENFYLQIANHLIRRISNRVIAADGQAVRRKFEDPTPHESGMLMSLYDAANHVCLMHRLIDKKTNEITVGCQMIDALALKDSVVTADAMSCQVKFVDSVLADGDGKGTRPTILLIALFKERYTRKSACHDDASVAAHVLLGNRQQCRQKITQEPHDFVGIPHLSGGQSFRSRCNRPKESSWDCENPSESSTTRGLR